MSPVTRVLSGAPARTRVLAGACVLVVLLGVGLGFRSCAPGVVITDGRAFAATLEPTAADALGVSPDSSFYLTLDKPVPLAAVREALAVSPEVDLRVRAEGSSGRVFSVTPEKPLEPDRVYRFVLALAGPDEPGYSWAFQVRAPVRVVRTLPGDRSSGVPVNTGIELEFSHEGVMEPGSLFSIEPAVEGTWERHRRTWVFVPKDPLRPGTIYTCTLEEGLGVEGSSEELDEGVTFRFETAPADTPGAVTYWLSVGVLTAEFAPGEPWVIPLSYGRSDGVAVRPRVRLSVHRYRDASSFLAGLTERESVSWWAWLSARTWRPSLDGLVPVLETTLEPLPTYGGECLVFAEGLSPGYYLASLAWETETSYVWVQVTDLAAHVTVAADDTVVWLNSLAGGRPVRGAEVRLLSSGSPLGVSGEDGLVRFRTPAELILSGDPPADEPGPPVGLLARAPDGSEVLSVLRPGWLDRTEGKPHQEDYWTYLYTDRPLYLPGDELCFWGVVEPRGRGTPEVSRVRVELKVWRDRVGWRGQADAGEQTVSSAEVEVRRHTLSGRLRLPGLRPGVYSVCVVADGLELARRYFEVATYTKPPYRIELRADRKAAFVGEPVRFEVEARFFEGTPVPGLRLDYNVWSSGAAANGVLVTDPAGRAVLVHTPRPVDSPRVVERTDQLVVNADLPETGPVWANLMIRVFERDVVLRATSVREPEGLRLDVRVNKVTLDRINAPAPGGAADPDPYSAGWGPESYLGAPVAGRAVQGEVEELRYEARDTGRRYYDFVEKAVRKVYEYVERRVPVNSFALVTDDEGAASWLFEPEEGKAYVVRLTTPDDAGRPTVSELWVYGTAWQRPWPEDPWYHLAYRDGEDATYLPGQTARLVVRADQQEVRPRPQGFLFYTARLGLEEVWVQDEPECSVVFEESFIPNTNVGAVCFDGRTYHTLWPVVVRYRFRERELDVRVDLDKPEYRPGETARITVEVRDPAGRPVAADVNLSMVDEALYQLAPERVDLLSAIYGNLVRSLVLASSSTHSRPVLYGGGAEGGGEGGGARSDFRDNALFESVTTGPDGRAAVEVTLPSNLTSWRLTYHVLASGVRGASGTIGIPVRLPFFVHLSAARTYLAGDRPVVLARAYGTSLPPGTEVTFDGELRRLDAGGKVAASYRLEPVQGVAGQPVELDLGRAAGGLGKGRWLLAVGGKAVKADGRVLEDKVEVPLDVLDTYVRVDRVEVYEVAEGLKLTAEPGEVVTLTFCDAARGRQLALLERLASGGRRVDMKAAQAVAYRLLTDHFGLDEELMPRPPAPAELALYQRQDGGVAVLPYGGSELELTAKIAALGAEGFDRTGLLAYLGRVYDDEAETRERRCVALWGLAALGEPVLLDLQEAAAAPDLSTQESLHIALGLIELGDEELARVVFGWVLERYGDPVGQLLRLNVSRDREENVRATSLAALVAARLRLAEAERFLDYLVSNEPWEELNFLELALALKESVPRTPAAPASLTLKPEGVKVELEDGRTYTRILTAEDLAHLEFADVRGGVTLCVTYRGSVDLGRTKVRSGEAAVERTYSVSGRAGTSFKAGDLVKVTLSYRISGQAPDGAYQLVDFLPSGLACVARPWEYWGPPDQNLGCPVEVDGQRVVFAVYNTPNSNPVTGKPLPGGTSGTITYYARVVSLGSFRAEPAVLVHMESGEFFAVTRQAEVTIR